MLKKLFNGSVALVFTSALAFAAFNLGFDGKIISQGSGTAPALTSCGASPTIVGTDVAGTVTTGTGTGCIITFNVAYVGVPNCTVSTQTAPGTSTPAYTVTATAITLVQASGAWKWNYTCVAQPGG